ncbi:MAG: alanine racemase [Balneolaceae bacterium]|nr:alanine racemase [Balneolaceae bacterium]
MDKSISHNAEITVSFSALEENLKVIRSHLGNDTKIMAVVKANAYGHGAIEVARFLADKVEWFAVNTVEEGIQLRESGIQNPILVFGVPEENHVNGYVRYNLTATISDLSHFDLLKDGANYHLNIDTGMGRLGILPSEIARSLQMVEKYDMINLTGLYTHFATADGPGSAKVEKQYQMFDELKQQFSDDILVHAANTGGIFFYPNTHFDMVRSGIGIYGYSPGETVVDGLVPVLRLRSKLVQVKTLGKGESVSYGATWTALKETNIGVIPIGYEDGIRRNLSGNLEVKIAGNKYPVIGTITMNYCMVDLGKDDYRIDTPVEILDAKALTAKKWAACLGTIPYEILTGLSEKIYRRYID